jgi:hypothetical protein
MAIGDMVLVLNIGWSRVHFGAWEKSIHPTFLAPPRHASRQVYWRVDCGPLPIYAGEVPLWRGFHKGHWFFPKLHYKPSKIVFIIMALQYIGPLENIYLAQLCNLVSRCSVSLFQRFVEPAE